MTHPSVAPPVIRPATSADLDTLLEHRLGMLEAVFPFDPAAVA